MLEMLVWYTAYVNAHNKFDNIPSLVEHLVNDHHQEIYHQDFPRWTMSELVSFHERLHCPVSHFNN